MNGHNTILVVDDEQKNLLIMESLLGPLGHRVVYAENGSQALEKIESESPDLILLDVMLPDMDGFRVCKLLKTNERTRLIPVILVTSLYDVADKVKGFESDADDFLSKPVNRHELMARIRSCLRIKALNDRLESSESVLCAFALAVEAKDPYTIGHSERVSKFSMDLGLIAGLEQERIAELKLGGLLHDIGKIGVPDNILSKPDKLTVEEFDEVKKHTVIGEKICQPLRSFGGILPLIRSHHERLDGSGYPDALEGDQITTPVRILAIADTFDAITSDRPYRPGLPLERVRKIFAEEVEKGRFEQDLVDLALERFTYWSDDLSQKSVEVPDMPLEIPQL